MAIEDLIQYLKTATPDRKKASNAFFLVGGLLLVPVIMRSVFGVLEAPDGAQVDKVMNFYEDALMFQVGSAILCLISGAAIRKRSPAGRQLGQGTILLLGAIFIYLTAQTLPEFFTHLPLERFQVFDLLFFLIPIVIMLVIVGSAAMIAFHSIRYLGRLEDEDPAGDRLSTRFAPEPEVRPGMSGAMAPGLSGGPSADLAAQDPQERYVEAVLYIGLLGTLAVFLVGGILIIGIISKYAAHTAIFPISPMILVIFIFLPVLYNRKKSGFEKTRHPIKKITGGGSIGLFSGTVPFFKLLIYDDAVELRVMFHAYLISYNRMSGKPEKEGSIFKGLLIKSDLPGVPSSIRFYGVSEGDIQLIHQHYNAANNIKVPSAQIEYEARQEKKKTKQVTRFAIITFIGVVLIHFLLTYLGGPMIGQIALRKEIGSSDHTQTFTAIEYQRPADNWGPLTFDYVVVVYDSQENVEKEVYYSGLGDVTVVYHKNREPSSSYGHYYSSEVTGAFPIIGMLLVILSQVFGARIFSKRQDTRTRSDSFGLLDKAQIVGFCMFLSFFIVAPLIMVFG